MDATNRQTSEQQFVDKLSVLRALSRPESSHRRDQKAGIAPPWLRIGARRTGLLITELDVLLSARAASLSIEEQRRLVAQLLEHRQTLGDAVRGNIRLRLQRGPGHAF